MPETKHILLKTVPEEVHKALRIAAMERGLYLYELIAQILSKWVKEGCDL